MKSLGQALRSLQSRPSFSAVVILTLGLAIGASTTVYSFFDAILLRPLPLPDSSRLCVVRERNLTTGERTLVAGANYFDWMEQSQSFTGLAAFSRWQPYIRQEGLQEQLSGARVTANFFAVLGVSPILGHGFDASSPAGTGQVVLSYELWQSRFGGDHKVIGRTWVLWTLNGEAFPCVIVGVMPSGFRFPWPLFADRPDLWSLLQLETVRQDRKGRSLYVVGRLRADATFAAAEAEIQLLARQLEQAYPATNRNWSAAVLPLQEEIVGDVRPHLLLLMAVVLCIQLMACANVANLFLSRTLNRMKELALRTALGAGRVRLVTHVVAEVFVLAALGGALAVVLAVWVTDYVRALAPAGIPRHDEVSVNGVVTAFALLSTMATGLFVSAAPAWYAARISPAPLLQGKLLPGLRPRFAWQARKALVAIQVGLAVALLVAGGLLLKSFVGISGMAAQVGMKNVVTAHLGLPGALFPQFHQRQQYYEDLVSRVTSLPGIVAAAAVEHLPQQRSWPWTFSTRKGESEKGFEGKAEVRVVQGDLFRVLAIPVLRGRGFRPADRAPGAPRVAIVNETLARRAWGTEDPVGRQIWIPFENQPYTVIGVVGDVRKFGFRPEPEPEIYVVASTGYPAGMVLLVRTMRPPSASLLASLRDAIRSAGEGVLVLRIAVLEDLWLESFSRPQVLLLLVGGFAVIGILVAIAGVYGVMSFAVAQRMHEFGIRMALGATPRRILSSLVADSFKLGLLGIGIGLAGAVFLSRLLKGMLFEVGTLDPVTYLVAFLLISLVTVLAGFAPARQVLRLDVAAILRSE
jgi:putative ABC transport system permease protein